MIGTKLAHYQITSHLGSGGMGDVYQATDSKLGRSVAIKLLPEAFARDAERVARFEREARLLASLNHPNIAAIHGLEDSSERKFLVMELVEGETLVQRIKRGPIPVDESLGIAKQICEALEAAHEKGIIHRDLKPANVKITPNGKVKVLDFGLAKAMENAPSSAPLSNSPTLSQAATNAGVILGTAAYMSPEQAKANAADRRADIWALGCVLYELLTGKPAFEGDSVTEILGGVLKAEPDWSALPESTPPAIRSLLRRCLRKDVQQRPRDAADIRLEIEEARAASSPAAVVLPSPAPAPRRWLLLSALACVLAASVTGIVVWQLRQAPPRPVERVVSALPANTTLQPANAGVGMLALSPDGRRLAFVAAGGTTSQRLYVRAMDALEAAPLSGTEGAINPFFSPDGEWIGFQSSGALKKISVGGGAALTLSNVPGAFGAAWGADNIIVFAPNAQSGLVRVSAAGGDPQPFTTLQQGEFSHRWPQFLPDGKTVLFSIGSGASFVDAQIAAQRLDSDERKVLIRGGTYARYVPTGHLVYYRAGTIMAVPFDPVKLEVKGSASPVVEEVLGVSTNGVAHFSISNLGSLAYVRGGSQSAEQTTMAWVNRQGVTAPMPAPPRSYRQPRLSPDGRQVAVGIGADIWIYDIARDTLTRLTFEGNNAATSPAWTPDGKRLIYPSSRGGPINLFWKPADGSGSEERLTTSPNNQRAGAISPDGRFEIMDEVSPKTGQDLWVLPLEGDRKPRVFLQTPFQETSARISPDGRWVAYSSDESGRFEVYVRPFPGPGGKWQVSTDGGSELAWSPKGNELFYRTGVRKEKMMVVDYQTQPTFSAGKPRLLFEGNYVANGGAGAFYSVAPDGQRFLMIKAPDQAQTALTQINVVLNWFEELKQKVPVK